MFVSRGVVYDVPIAKNLNGYVFEQVVLERHGSRKTTVSGRRSPATFAGAPGHRMRRSARHLVDFLGLVSIEMRFVKIIISLPSSTWMWTSKPNQYSNLEGCNKARFLNSGRCSITELAFVVVPPRVDLSLVGAHDAVERSCNKPKVELNPT